MFVVALLFQGWSVFNVNTRCGDDDRMFVASGSRGDGSGRRNRRPLDTAATSRTDGGAEAASATDITTPEKGECSHNILQSSSFTYGKVRGVMLLGL